MIIYFKYGYFNTENNIVCVDKVVDEPKLIYMAEIELRRTNDDIRDFQPCFRFMRTMLSVTHGWQLSENSFKFLKFNICELAEDGSSIRKLYMLPSVHHVLQEFP